MRGLKILISDLSKCKGKDEELKRVNKELANIRSKFKGDKLLNGYQKRKYICKLIFLFMMGYKCDLGLMEAINLLSSNVFSEKRAGYLFISVVKDEKLNLMPLIINAVKSDLQSSKDIFQNLALQFIANSSSLNLIHSLADPVTELLTSPDTKDFVKQNAIFALLQILRIKSDYIPTEHTVNFFINLFSHRNLGLVSASVCLIEYLAKRFPSRYEKCMVPCIATLYKFVSSNRLDFHDYNYAVAPLVCVKLLRILQNFPAPSNVSSNTRLADILVRILKKADDTPNNFEQNNAKYAVIFETINLIIQMEIGGSVLSQVFSVLRDTLQHKEPNLKFMALETMIRLSDNKLYSEEVKSEWSTVLNLLQFESNMEIRMKTVNLLYAVCFAKSVKPIVEELLNLLKSEQDIPDIMQRTAALAEQFSSDREWYFDTIIRLLQICGDKASDSTWHSLIKVIIENDDMQEYAAKASFAVLCERNCNDSVIKLAGYILGEFGYLIANDSRSSYKQQFNILREKYCECSPTTKAILLATFMKFHSIYPDMKDEVRIMLKDPRTIQTENEELQQRDVDNITLGETASNYPLATIDTIPFSLRKVSATVVEIEKKKVKNLQVENYLKRKNLRKLLSQCHLKSATENIDEDRLQKFASHPALSLVAPCHDDFSSNLNFLVYVLKDTSKTDAVTKILPSTSRSTPQITNVQNNQPFLYNLLFNEKGKLYENDIIVIFIENEFNKNWGRFHIKYMNKTENEFSEFCIQGNFSNIQRKCSVWFKPCKSILSAKETMEQNIHLECLNEFTDRSSLILHFAFKNQYNKINLTLPLTLNKFIEPSHMAPNIFARRWQQFESLSPEVVKEFLAKYPMIDRIIRQKLEGFRLAVIENANSENFHCAGVFYMREKRIGFLIQLERCIRYGKYCMKVRSGQFSLSQTISNLLSELL